jgi:hypothetical protein
MIAALLLAARSPLDENTGAHRSSHTSPTYPIRRAQAHDGSIDEVLTPYGGGGACMHANAKATAIERARLDNGVHRRGAECEPSDDRS